MYEANESGKGIEPGEGMYVITRVEQQIKNPNKYDPYINDEYALTVHEDTLVSLKLLKGTHLTVNDLSAIKREEHVREIQDKAMRWLARRAYAKQEIIRKLRWQEIEESTIDIVIRRLVELKLIDDRLFAEQWAQQRIVQQAKGRHLVRHELMQKGVPRADIEAALAQFNEEDEYEQAMQLARKKWLRTKGEPLAKKHKTAAYLMRRGFSAEIAKKAVSNFVDDMDENGYF